VPHSSRLIRPRTGKRRKTEWFQGVGDAAETVFSASSVSILGSGVITSFGEETLIRTRGLFAAVLESATSVGDGFFGAIGIGKATSSAFAAGIASLPTPLTEINWDGWLYHSFFSLHSSLGQNENQLVMVIDSKAARIVGTDETLYAAIEVVEIGTAIMSVHLDTRMLSKLA